MRRASRTWLIGLVRAEIFCKRRKLKPDKTVLPFDRQCESRCLVLRSLESHFECISSDSGTTWTFFARV